jgi:Taurine catabolism dioxygenase TauD, TfdA family
MIDTFIINYKNISDIKDNVAEYFSYFIKNSNICFRGGDLSRDEQVEILKIFGDYCGWNPNSKLLLNKENIESFENNAFYYENHDRSKPNKKTKDETIITWHMEHAWRNNPTIAASWNMKIFTCDDSCGQTHFVDTNKVWNMLDKEDQEFLAKCGSYFYSENKKYEVNSVKRHWWLNQNIINLDLWRNESNPYLANYDGDEPDIYQIDNFNRIHRFVIDQVLNNEDIKIIHKWKQGDVLMPDLHKLAHTVTGGFEPEERYFIGAWASLKKYD